MFEYPVQLTPDVNDVGETSVLVTAPDLPELTTYGDDEASALVHARDALVAALMIYIADRRPIPDPSPAVGRPTVAPPLHVATKALVYKLMHDQRLSQSDLARRIGCDPKQVQRLLDLSHQSPVKQIDAALDALQVQPVLSVKAA